MTAFLCSVLHKKTSQRFLQSIWAFIVWHCILAMQLRLAAASYIQAYAVLALPHKQKTHNQLPCALQGIFVPQAASILLSMISAFYFPRLFAQALRWVFNCSLQPFAFAQAKNCDHHHRCISNKPLLAHPLFARAPVPCCIITTPLQKN
jgi:hypothetical protein